MEISTKFSRSVFDDARAAYADPVHPCYHLLAWQKERGIDPPQMPEPFSGRSSALGLAFIGLNPSLNAEEVNPCLRRAIRFTDYDAFFRGRFDDNQRDEQGRPVIRLHDGTSTAPRLWRCIERMGNQFLKQRCVDPLRGFRLGTDALLIEAIRYKTIHGWLGDSNVKVRRVLEHEDRMTAGLIDDHDFSVLVPMGSKAFAQLQRVVRFLDPAPRTITAAVGQLYRVVTTSGREIRVCPMRHLSWPAPLAETKRAAEQVLRGLDR
jgi:hypothetical protein